MAWESAAVGTGTQSPELDEDIGVADLLALTESRQGRSKDLVPGRAVRKDAHRAD